MRVRVVRCPEDAHELPWVLAADCEHWSMTCPRARKAKKPKHKFDRGEPGFDIAVTGIPEDGWPYDYKPPPEALELIEKRYAGSWQGPDGSRWEPAPRGNLVTCATGCGFVGAIGA